MKLSILTPSLTLRDKYYKNLLEQIKKQLTLDNCQDAEIRPFWKENFDYFRYEFKEEVEFILMIDDKENTIGYKRNKLLEYAKGDYLCFVDCDDRISENYFELLLKAIKTNPDCCSLNGIITTDGINAKEFKHSIKYTSWYEENNIYYRPPNHLNCIKSEIAKQFLFPETNSGEDMDWSLKIQRSGLLKNECEIKETLYYYDYISNK